MRRRGDALVRVAATYGQRILNARVSATGSWSGTKHSLNASPASIPVGAVVVLEIEPPGSALVVATVGKACLLHFPDSAAPTLLTPGCAVRQP